MAVSSSSSLSVSSASASLNLASLFVGVSVKNLKDEHLVTVLSSLGWSYFALWSLEPGGVLAWVRGLWLDSSSSSYQQQTIFNNLYTGSSFEFATGHAGLAQVTGHHHWLSGTDQVVQTDLHFQKTFLVAAQVQTVLCIPLADGTMEIGSTSIIAEEDTLPQLHSQLAKALYLNTTPETTHFVWPTMTTTITRASAFHKWEPSTLVPTRASGATSQNMIKKSLHLLEMINQVSRLPGSGGSERPISAQHVITERMRRRAHRESINVLRTFLPSRPKDRLSILRGTVDRLRDLQARVSELEQENSRLRSHLTRLEPAAAAPSISREFLVVEPVEENIVIRINITTRREPGTLPRVINYLWNQGMATSSVDANTENRFQATIVAKPVRSNQRVQCSQIEGFLRLLLWSTPGTSCP